MDVKYDDDVSTSDTGERNAREQRAQSWTEKGKSVMAVQSLFGLEL